MAGGRPSDYTEEKAAQLCEYLSSGMSLRKACEHENMPSAKTVFKWLRDYPEFLQQYTLAKQEAADAMVDDMLEIADDGRNDFMELNDPDNPAYKVNGEHINRSRLRVETRKWIAAKLKPKVYGDRQALEHSGSIDSTQVVITGDISPEQAAEAYAKLMG